MAKVAFARHLYRFFPQLEGQEIELPAASVAELVRGLEALAPGIGFYLADERGALRQHVNIFVEDDLILDREHLSDGLKPHSRVYVMQALSGG